MPSPPAPQPASCQEYISAAAPESKHPTMDMDRKTPLQFENLPAPAIAAEGESARRKHKKCKKHKIFKRLGFSALLLWVGARYLKFESPMSFQLADEAWPIPNDMSVDHCEPWSDNGETDPDITEDFPYSADASFELPASADTLFLISRSVRNRRVFSTGRVNYLQSEEVSDSVKVDITAYFWHEEYLDASKACLLTRDDDQTGVGVFTKWKGEERRRREHEKLRFDVTVTFPRTEDESPLAINRFLTDLEFFSQTFADLSNVAFGKLYLKSALAGIRGETLYAGNASISTSLGPIQIQSLIAPEATLSTSLGAIEGTYNASKLTLRTANGPINVDVNLSNDEDDTVAQLTMHTSNGRIQSNINLLSSKEDSSDASFDIAARTAHGPVDLVVLSAPLNSNITLAAHTAIGAASASPSSHIRRVLPRVHEPWFGGRQCRQGCGRPVGRGAEPELGV
ncbi:DUF4097 domain-containing protein [Mycena venus]|uniref:DUF4097 domain-containing protein n=1 Tax=Mycena venus TaxID=2733690 RepID=A0A8H7D6B3_9AGAR|nr:DUF4097 domain-containing protein [Mycena venus]